MSIKVTRLPEAERRARHIAIGTFDGVHVGHRQVIDRADTVLTFEPHPLSVIHPEAAPKLIMPFEIKRDVIEGLGVDELVVIPFDRSFSHHPAEEFCSRILVDTLGAERVSVGENFRFGAKAKGDPEMLRLAHGVRDPGRAAGRGRRRDRLLDPDPVARRRGRGRGRDPLPRGAVPARGDGRGGRREGPHARLPDREPGARRTTASPGPRGLRGVRERPARRRSTSGVRPTFETGRGLLIEAYLIDHEGDLYGQTLRVAFIARLRGERRFPSVEELVAQMRRDVEAARELCASFTPP